MFADKVLQFLCEVCSLPYEVHLLLFCSHILQCLLINHFVFNKSFDIPFTGIGMDTCVIPLRFGGLSLLQTTDFFYPLVDDPYMMVKSYFG